MATAPVRPSTALINFESILEVGEAWVKWVDGAEEFQAAIKSNIPWDRLDVREKELMQRRLKEQQPSHQLLLNSLYLTMASSFEEFLRSTISQTAASFYGSKTKYEDLSEIARNLHLRETAKLLRRLDSMPDYLTTTTAELCSAIGSCIPGSKSVMVCAEVFGDLDGLIRLENFFERMRVLDKQISFDLLGSKESIAASLKLRGSKARAVGTALETCVAQVSKNRNRIAHTGGTAADVSRELLEEHRGVLKAVAVAIAGC